MKSLLFSENTLTAAWFCELQSDWAKILFGSQNLVKDHKVKKHIQLLVDTPTVGQQNEGYYLKIVLLNFSKLSVYQNNKSVAL